MNSETDESYFLNVGDSESNFLDDVEIVVHVDNNADTIKCK